MVILTGRTVSLRTSSPDDVEARFALGNDPEIVGMFGLSQGDVKPLTREAAGRWVQGIGENPNAWIIDVDGRLIGTIRLDNINSHDRRASMAVGIYDPQLLGKGYGTEAIRLVLDHAFSTLRLHRIGIRVLAYNTRAIRAYEKCGFVVEGRERETVFINGAWQDDIMMGLLATEFQGLPSPS